mgnify:CR=1 FL=1
MPKAPPPLFSATILNESASGGLAHYDRSSCARVIRAGVAKIRTIHDAETSVSDNARMNSGLVPQQPPMMFAPASTSFLALSANSCGVMR